MELVVVSSDVMVFTYVRAVLLLQLYTAIKTVFTRYLLYYLRKKNIISIL